MNPTAGSICEPGRRWTQQIVRMRDEGRTILLSTHVMEQAQRLCDSVMLIHRGRKVLDGPLAAVLGRADPRTIILETEEDAPDLTRLAFVEAVEQSNRHQEIRLVAGPIRRICWPRW